MYGVRAHTILPCYAHCTITASTTTITAIINTTSSIETSTRTTDTSPLSTDSMILIIPCVVVIILLVALIFVLLCRHLKKLNANEGIPSIEQNEHNTNSCCNSDNHYFFSENTGMKFKNKELQEILSQFIREEYIPDKSKRDMTTYEKQFRKICQNLQLHLGSETIETDIFRGINSVIQRDFGKAFDADKFKILAVYKIPIMGFGGYRRVSKMTVDCIRIELGIGN